MKNIMLFLTLLALLISCDEEKIEDIYYNAIVLEKGLDCGETFLIQFKDSDNSLINNEFDNTFYAINLNEEYKIENLEIRVLIRNPLTSELLACTTLGTAYPQIFIVKVEN